MENTITTLSTTVSSNALWEVFADAIPYISVVVLTAFGFYLIRKMLKGLAKGKARI